MASFERDFRYTKSDAKHVNSLAVSLQQLGAFVACFFIWPITYKIGRKWSIAICSLVFCVGAAIQTAQTHSTSAFYVGRVIAGLGLGGSSVVVPMFSSEMTPKQIRGQVGSFYQLMFTLGMTLAASRELHNTHGRLLILRQASSLPTGSTGVLTGTLPSPSLRCGSFLSVCSSSGPVSLAWACLL